jgi:uncharacterized protein YkwD
MAGSTAGKHLRAAVALAASTAAALLVIAVGPAVAPASAACPHAGAHPREVPLPKLRKAITCLINHERARRGRVRLTPDGRLQDAAQDHNEVMLDKDCFRHDCPGEPGLGRRLKRSGYIKPHRITRFAEDLGYESTPRKMVKLWLHSRFNRRNMLRMRFRDLGVGVGWGAPKRGVDDDEFATYTVVFALSRSRR